MMHPLLVQAAVIAATWDAWRWYFGRIAAAPEEATALGVLTLVLAVLGLPRLARGEPGTGVPLLPLALLLALYAGSYGVLPPILRCAIAVIAALFPLSIAAFRRPPPLALWALATLALPVLPSLQFTLGFPMRVVCAGLAAALLQMQGLAVAHEATFLAWRGASVQFDAPCSGVNMLWAGLLLTLAACTLMRLDVVRTTAVLACAIALNLTANVVRAVSLFYIQAGLVDFGASWWHEAMGLLAFAPSAAATLWIVMRIGGSERRAAWSA
jgi:exosortase/archaeosortase family protein